MTVESIIQELKMFNPKAQVKLHHPNGANTLYILGLAYDNNTVFIEDVTDVDLKQELNSFFELCISNGDDELYFYETLIERGITPEALISQGLSEEAEHMQLFCKDHGLL